jgi:hypothetical protein
MRIDFPMVNLFAAVKMLHIKGKVFFSGYGISAKMACRVGGWAFRSHVQRRERAPSGPGNIRQAA